MKKSLLKRTTIFFSLILTTILFYNFQTFSKTRIIRIGVVTYGGYAPGFYYNGGLKVSRDSKFYKKHRILVELQIVDDYIASRKMFEDGELDLLWMTVGAYAGEANYFAEKNNAKVVFVSSKSKGADAIVATRKIEKPRDLIGKTIAISELTPSHSLLLAYLEKHGISEKEVKLEKFVTKEVVDKVRVAFNELDRKIELKPVFEKLNEEISYGEIRLSIALILKNE